ncbi:hypothetical protein E4T56_gene18728, partial [Termitomyces sp. T112]
MLGLQIALPHADPDRAPPRSQFFERQIKQLLTQTHALRLFAQVKLVKLPITILAFGMGQFARPDVNIGDQRPCPILRHPRFRHPGPVAVIGQFARDGRLAIGIRLKQRQIGGRIGNRKTRRPESLPETMQFEGGQRADIVCAGRANGDVGSHALALYQRALGRNRVLNVKGNWAAGGSALLRMGISAKFLASFTVLLLVMAAMGSFAVVKLGEVNAIATELRERWLPGSQALGDVHAFVAQYRIKQSAHVSAGSEGIKARQAKLMRAAQTAIDTRMNDAAKLNQSPEMKAAFEKLKGDWQTYLGQNEQLLSLSNSDPAAAKAMFDGDSLTAFYTVEDDLLTLIDLNTKGANAASAHSATIYDQGRKVIVGAVVGGEGSDGAGEEYFGARGDGAGARGAGFAGASGAGGGATRGGSGGAGTSSGG